MLGSSEWSSRCESGWTLYLDHSLSSSLSPSCSRDIINSFRERRRRSRSKDSYEVEEEEEEEEEDLSMVSDASSGPMNVSEEESVKKLSVKKESDREKRRSKDEFLDDTASSPVYGFSCKSVDERFAESESDYSQGFSATQFQMGAVESHFKKPSYIFNTSNSKTLTIDSLGKIPTV